MNSFAAANLFDNPLVLTAIVVVWVLVSWLMKRRQRSDAANRPDGDELLPPPDQTPGRSQRQLDLQDALRQLLGGEPPPQAPLPPPMPRAVRDGEPSQSWSDEEQEGAWTGETQEAYEEARPAAREFAEPSRQHAIALAQTNANRIEAEERDEKADRRFAQLIEQGEHPATVVSTERGRHSHTGARAVSLWGDPRTVRRAFVASLIFAPPKAFEN